MLIIVISLIPTVALAQVLFLSLKKKINKLDEVNMKICRLSLWHKVWLNLAEPTKQILLMQNDEANILRYVYR